MYFCSEDGVLYDKKKTIMYLYPDAKKETVYVMPETVTGHSLGFADNPYIEEITLSSAFNRVTQITMANCKNLKKITVLNPDCEFEYYDEAVSNGLDDHGNYYYDGYIYGYAGTKTEEFAVNCGFKFIALDGEPPQMSGECGENVKWELSEDGVLTISGTGDMEDWSEEGSPFFRRWDISSVVIKEGVTSIGGYAFEGCPFLEHVEIPASVTKTGYECFSKCKALRSITIPETLTDIEFGMFSKCRYLDDVKLPGNMTEIPVLMFSNCEYLKNIDIPGSVTTIDKSAFMGCDSFEEVIIPETVEAINENAFAYCRGLKSITIKNPECDIADSEKTIYNDIVKYVYEYNGVIRGYEGSTAQEYAEKYGYKFESLGEYVPETTEPVTTEPVTTTVTTVPAVTGTDSSATTVSTSVTTVPGNTETTVSASAVKPTIKGDISGNGKIDIYDAIEVAKSILGIRKFTEEELPYADFNGDGKVDLYDAIDIAKYIIEHIND